MTTRDNGLHAGSYTPLTALTSASADSVLESLRRAGVAAYVVGGQGATMSRLVLWVDSGATVRAREVLSNKQTDVAPPPEAADQTGASRGEQAQRAPLDEDALWRSIVASFDVPTSDALPRWPESENVEEPPEDAGEQPGTGRVLRRIHPRGPAARSGPGEGGSGPASGPASEPGPVGDEGHYVPPPPPPLPRPDPVTRWAWVGLLGGPLFLFVTALLGQQLADWLVLVALAGFVVGFVTLVARMKDRPPRDSGGDDGAVV